MTSTFGRHRPRQSTAVDSKVDSGRQWTYMVPVNLWSTVVDSGRQWVDRRMVDRGSTVVDSAVDRVDRVDRVDSQGSRQNIKIDPTFAVAVNIKYIAIFAVAGGAQHSICCQHLQCFERPMVMVNIWVNILCINSLNVAPQSLKIAQNRLKSLEIARCRIFNAAALGRHST